jgi:hypothetical protein
LKGGEDGEDEQLGNLLEEYDIDSEEEEFIKEVLEVAPPEEKEQLSRALSTKENTVGREELSRDLHTPQSVMDLDHIGRALKMAVEQVAIISNSLVKADSRFMSGNNEGEHQGQKQKRKRGGVDKQVASTIDGDAPRTVVSAEIAKAIAQKKGRVLDEANLNPTLSPDETHKMEQPKQVNIKLSEEEKAKRKAAKKERQRLERLGKASQNTSVGVSLKKEDDKKSSKPSENSSMNKTAVSIPTIPRLSPVETLTTVVDASNSAPMASVAVPSNQHDGKGTSMLSSEEKARRKALKRERRIQQKLSKGILMTEPAVSVLNGNGSEDQTSLSKVPVPVPSTESANLTKKRKRAAKKARLGPTTSGYFAEPPKLTRASPSVSDEIHGDQKHLRRKNKTALRKAELLKTKGSVPVTGSKELQQAEIKEVAAGDARFENWIQRAENTRNLAKESGLPDDLAASLAKAREAVEHANQESLKSKRKRKRKRNHNLLDIGGIDTTKSGKKDEINIQEVGKLNDIQMVDAPFATPAKVKKSKLKALDETIVDERDEVGPVEAAQVATTAMSIDPPESSAKTDGRKRKVSVDLSTMEAEPASKPKRRDRGRKSKVEVAPKEEARTITEALVPTEQVAEAPTPNPKSIQEIKVPLSQPKTPTQSKSKHSKSSLDVDKPLSELTNTNTKKAKPGRRNRMSKKSGIVEGEPSSKDHHS